MKKIIRFLDISREWVEKNIEEEDRVILFFVLALLASIPFID